MFDNGLVDNNFSQPVVAPNPNQLINIQLASYKDTQLIVYNSEIQTTSNNGQTSISINNQNIEKETYPL